MEQKILTKGETNYQLRLFPTMLGLKLQRKLSMIGEAGPEPETFFEVISQGCSINSIAVSQKKFDDHFRGKYEELLEVFYAILAYNFGGAQDDPNMESDTSE